MLRFNDGVNIDTQGEFRAVKLADGLYVVGHGICVPVDSEDDAKVVIAEMNKKQQQ